MRIRKSDLKSLIREVVEECLILNEGSMDKMTHTELWQRHRDAQYDYDQGWGPEVKGSQKTMKAIEGHVAKKYGAAAAKDMKKFSEEELQGAEYGSADKGTIKKLKAKHDIGDTLGFGPQSGAISKAVRSRKAKDSFHSFGAGRKKAKK